VPNRTKNILNQIFIEMLKLQTKLLTLKHITFLLTILINFAKHTPTIYFVDNLYDQYYKYIT
jgi:hypothetical protein